MGAEESFGWAQRRRLETGPESQQFQRRSESVVKVSVRASRWRRPALALMLAPRTRHAWLHVSPPPAVDPVNKLVSDHPRVPIALGLSRHLSDRRPHATVDRSTPSSAPVPSNLPLCQCCRTIEPFLSAVLARAEQPIRSIRPPAQGSSVHSSGIRKTTPLSPLPQRGCITVWTAPARALFLVLCLCNRYAPLLYTTCARPTTPLQETVPAEHHDLF